MKKFILFFITLIFIAQHGTAQDKKDVLMTVNSQPVYASEFMTVYNKNLDLVQDESQKDIDTYLALFEDYKLKVAEAYAQKLDRKPEYIKEFNTYQDQLSRNYLFKSSVTEDLTREAFERGKEEIKAAHILIKVTYDETPQDTLIAYNKIKSLRDRALNGEDFEELARKNSEEPNAEKTAGILGYFTVFNLVYPFETEGYKTKVGDVSNIVRTSFGYHLIKVLDRRERSPQIAVSHIMIGTQGGERTFDPETRINEIYSKLEQGESFESLARQFSDDKSSANKGGELNKFSRGDLRSTEFEDAAYALTKPGDYTKPVKTDFGWHIIKLTEKFGIPKFEDQKVELEKKVSEGDRSKIITNAIDQQIKDKYGFKNINSPFPLFHTVVGDEILTRKYVVDTNFVGSNKVLFTIGKKEVKNIDFANFIMVKQKSMKAYKLKIPLLENLYAEFETEQLKTYFKEQLEFENEDYAAILNEYRNGLLIFDVMNKNVWDKAKNDTIALQKYYEANTKQYNWKQRVNAEIVSANSQDIAKQVQDLMKEGKTIEEIREALNKDKTINVIVSSGTFEMDNKELPSNFDAAKGVSKAYEVEDSFVIVNVKDILPPTPKTFEEVKGRVIGDYQNILEQQWIQSLHDKYKVDVNQKTLKKIKKELGK